MTSSEEAPLATLPRNVRLLGAASLLNDIASEMIYPLLPHFLLTVLGGNRWHLGIIEGVADSTASLLKLGSGAWSDRMSGRKPFIICGYALATVARPLVGLSTLPWHLFVARTADRVGKGIRTAPRDALIADSTDPAMHGRAFGFHRAMDHLGAAAGPLVAFLILWLWPGALRLLFLLTIIPGGMVVLLLILGLREAAASSPRQPIGRFSFRPLNRPFRWYLVSLVFFTLGNASDAFLLVRVGELGVSARWIPLLWCAFHVVKSGTNLLAGRIVDRIGPRPLILVGWLAYAVIYVGFAAIQTAWQAWLLFLLYGLFFALTEPAEKTLVTVLTGRERKGLAFGWFNFAIGVAALPSSLIFGGLYERMGPQVAFGWGALLSLLAALMLLGISSVPPAEPVD